MFKCKKINDAIMIQTYLEEFNKNDLTHVANLFRIATREKNFISDLQCNIINFTDYKLLSIFQNIDEAESFIISFKIECDGYIYKECVNYCKSSDKLIDNAFYYFFYDLVYYIGFNTIYTDIQLDTLCENIKAMISNELNIFSYYEDEDFEYEVNYEEDITTLTALTYPYQLFL